METKNYETICKEFTAKANEYVAKGYWFSSSMSGHQGEEMKVDLTNGKETIRILLDDFSKTNWDTYVDEDGLELSVIKFDKVVAGHRLDTLWNDRGEVLYSKKYYMIGSCGRYDVDTQAYVESIEDFNKVAEIKVARRENKFVSSQVDFTDDKMMNIAVKFVRKQDRCKTKTAKDIRRFWKMKNDSTGKYQYRISLNNGKDFRLN